VGYAEECSAVVFGKIGVSVSMSDSITDEVSEEL
jgi:hypothetical protein